MPVNKIPLYKRAVGGLAHPSTTRNSVYQREQLVPTQVLLPKQEYAERSFSEASSDGPGALGGPLSPISVSPTPLEPVVISNYQVIDSSLDTGAFEEPRPLITISRMDEEIIEDLVDLQQQVDQLRRDVVQEKAQRPWDFWEQTSSTGESPKVSSLDDVVSLPSRISGGPGGDRRHPRTRPHFHYSHASNSRGSGNEDSFEDSDEEDMVSCIREAIRCCKARRRRARALIDLVGIEPNPGPGGKKTKKQVVNHIKVPNQRKANGKSSKTPSKQVAKYLAGQVYNPRAEMAAYMATLCDPERYPAVRLGGETMINTALASLHGTYTAAVPDGTNNSVAGLYHFVFHPRLWSPFLISERKNTDSTYFYYGNNVFNQNVITQLQQFGNAARVVSCKIKIFSLAAGTADNGVITLGLVPRDDGFYGNNVVLEAGASGGNGTDISKMNAVSSGGFPIWGTSYYPTTGVNYQPTQGHLEFSTLDTTEAIPLKDGASCFWLPEDSGSFDFLPHRIREQFTIVDTAPSNQNRVATNPIVDPFFVGSISGAAPGSQIRFEFFLNIEYVTTSGSSSMISESHGSMTSTQAFSVAKRVGGNLRSTVEPSPSASLGDSLTKVGKSIVRGGLSATSRFLFSSSDMGDAIADIIGV